MARRLLDHLELADVSCVIDIGAGVGSLLPDIAGIAPRSFVFGVDRSVGMIARAPRAYGRAVMDATRLGLRDGSVDAAVMAFVLFHLPDPLDGLTETRRALRSGGRIGTATWGPEESWPAFELWGRELDAHGADPRSSLMSQHDLVDSPEKIDALLRKAGFVDVRVWRETLRRQFDRDTFVEFVTGMAISKRRLDSLDPEPRESFMAEAARRLDDLEPDDFILRSEVVLASARKP
jgi:ubiquinone/menaquinone biosynthesis C-methylase UbiE